MIGRLKLVRPREVPVFKLLGWKDCGDYDASFVLMEFLEVPRETNPVDLTRILETQE